ncbi:MAG: polysaccharide deacetylase family protein [Blastocatellia bacterium]
MKVFWTWLLLSVCCVANLASAQPPPVYVTLWFDTEDYILPQSDDAAKRLAEMLTRLGIKATFKVVGEKARVLEQRGRQDVIAALKKHEIGYHSNLHSQHPTPAEYLQNADWDEGVATFYRREVQGVKDIQRIFGQTPSCYGQPGSSWGPQSYPALQQLGINVYLDEADHVGIDEQPFYYGGLLNIFKMRSNVVRMDLFGEDNLAKGKAKFLAAYEKLKAKGGGTISIYYHPCEWVHREFWDGVNFSRGANPPRSEWKLPRTRTSEETDNAFRDFEAYVKFIKAQQGVQYVTANELKLLYEDQAKKKSFSKPEVELIAQAVQTGISFVRMNGYTLSAADTFSILQEALRNLLYDDSFPLPRMEALLGPVKPPEKAVPSSALQPIPFASFKQVVEEVSSQLATTKRIPEAVKIGSASISPADYLATLGEVLLQVMKPGHLPRAVAIRNGKFTADKYVADDDPKIFNWVIHPEGFHAPKLMQLAKLQAWTLKPAILKK